MTGKMRSSRVAVVLQLMMLVGMAACERGSADEGAALQVSEGARMEGSVMIYDDAMRKRHADEADVLVREARAHIADMRTADPTDWSERTDSHADIVARVTRAVDRQMRERDMNMNMADERNGEAMGISGAEYRGMREQLRALRAEAQALKTASDADLRAQMGPHLEQFEGFVENVAKSAAFMRSQLTVSHE